MASEFTERVNGTLDAAGREDEQEWQEFLRQPGARPDEAVLTFADEAAYRRFLSRAGAAGWEVQARLDRARSVRVKARDYALVARDRREHPGDYQGVAPNVRFDPPLSPEPRAVRDASPVGDDLLALLGVQGQQTNAWGQGVTIAVLDGGVVPDATLAGRLRYLDIGYGNGGTGTGGEHATAVAALAAGAASDARGVAPGADILSIRVAREDGGGDIFGVAQGIYAAVDAGARVINISMGGYQTGTVLTEAVAYAESKGALLIASAGNDQLSRLAWPAAYPSVISVGSVDATEQQLVFSNSGPGLQITAPGYAITTAGLAGTRVLFSGTSASAPVVAGALAVLWSENPGLSAAQITRIATDHANDGGAPGADPDYGHGVLNLGWARDWASRTRSDTALGATAYDATEGTLQVLVQNRGATKVAGLSVEAVVGGQTTRWPLAALAPGASTQVTVPVDQGQLTRAGALEFSTRLVNPSTIKDLSLGNNLRQGVLQAPVTKTP